MKIAMWAFVLLLLTSPGGLAYRLLPYEYRRPYLDMCVHVHPESNIPRSDALTLVREASDRWNGLPGNKFRVGLYEVPEPPRDESRSCVYIVHSRPEDAAPGLTVHNMRGNTVQSVQMYIQTSKTPDVTTLRNVLLHEFGHVHLLDHPNPDDVLAVLDPAKEVPIMATKGRVEYAGGPLVPEPPRDIQIDDMVGIIALHAQ